MPTIQPHTPQQVVHDEIPLSQERQEIIDEAQLTSTQYGVDRLDLDFPEDTQAD